MNPLLFAAITELDNLNSGEIFLVKDLFKGYEWNRFEKSARLTLGILFINHVRNNPSINLIILDNALSHQQKYRKN